MEAKIKFKQWFWFSNHLFKTRFGAPMSKPIVIPLPHSFELVCLQALVYSLYELARKCELVNRNKDAITQKLPHLLGIFYGYQP